MTRCRVVWAALLLAASLAACGGGGGTAGPAYVVVSVSPGGLFSERAQTLRVNGSGFSTGGGARRVQIQAAAGTPFGGGTTATLDLPATQLGDGAVECDVPATHVTTSFDAWVVVILDDGSFIGSASPLLQVVAQKITNVSPQTFNASAPQPFVLTGEGFDATSNTVVDVRFEPLSGAFFHVGIFRQGTLTVPGAIQSAIQISGSVPYMGVAVPVACRIVVTLSDGTEIRQPPGDQVLLDPGTMGVSGTWTYERPLGTPTGLDYGTISELPVRGAKVQLLRWPAGTVITERTLDDTGSYHIHYGVAERVWVRVLSETGPAAPPIRVHDNTQGGALYGAEGAPFDLAPGFLTRDYVVELGWGGASYTGPRASAPFAVLDAAYQASAAFLAERTISFAPCTLNWSVENRPSVDYDVTTGEIQTSHYIGGEIFVLGKEDVDTDEFDEHVIAHEWGHFFEDLISRSDSLAGPHGPGFWWLDPTVSFSEGFATALSAAVYAPDSVYRDSFDVGQANGFADDVEDNSPEGGPFAPNTGWFSESSVFWLLLDVIDSENEGAHDTLSLGLGPIYDAMAGAHKDTPYAATIFSLLAALKAENPLASSGIDTLCALHGIDPVADARGTGESNDGGWAENLPVYHAASIGGGSVFAVLDNSYDYNWVDSNRRFTFVGSGGGAIVDVLTPASVTFIDDFDIQLRVYHNGTLVGFADYWYELGEVLELPDTVAGDVYVVLVTDISPGDPAYLYEIDLLITTP